MDDNSEIFEQDDQDYEALEEHIQLYNLDKALATFCGFSNKEQKVLTSKSTLEEVAHFFNEFKNFDLIIEKINVAPDRIFALETLLAKIENEVFPEDILQKPSTLLTPIYEACVLGDYNKSIGEYSYWLLVSTDSYNEEKNLVEEINIVSKSNLLQIAKGVVYAFKIPELKSKLFKLKNLAIQEDVNEEIVHFAAIPEKYVLLHELGILDFIKQKYAGLSNKKLALLYSYITDTKRSKSYEMCISQHGQKEDDHYPFKEKNLDKVENIFIKVGIKINKRKVEIKQ